MKVKIIEIQFPFPVETPPGWAKALDALLEMICQKYEKENPTRVMWPSGMGAKPLWQEPLEPDFDDNIYFVEISEREKSIRNQ